MDMHLVGRVAWRWGLVEGTRTKRFGVVDSERRGSRKGTRATVEG